MDEYVKWSVGHFWQRILGSDQQASFIKSAGDPLFGSFTTSAGRPPSFVSLYIHIVTYGALKITGFKPVYDIFQQLVKTRSML